MWVVFRSKFAGRTSVCNHLTTLDSCLVYFSALSLLQIIKLSQLRLINDLTIPCHFFSPFWRAFLTRNSEQYSRLITYRMRFQASSLKYWKQFFWTAFSYIQIIFVSYVTLGYKYQLIKHHKLLFQWLILRHLFFNPLVPDVH